jgi:DNA repair photolyase
MMGIISQRIMKRFHKDLVTLKAHHWKNFFDLYRGCLHNCSYCLYRRNEAFGREIQPIKGVNTDRLAEELDAVKPVGITYLGAISDVYQPIEEKLRLTRSMIEVFCKKHLPLIIATKVSLILRDIDLLTYLASKGLVEFPEISFNS